MTRQMSVADAINLFSIGLSILVFVCMVVWVAVNSPIWFGKKKAVKLTTLKPIKAADRTYSVNIYQMRNGSMVWHVGHFDLDTVFKVAQFAPPMFEEWTTGWQLHDKAEIYRQYWRGYYADDGEIYAMLVGTSDGLWSEYAEAYLGHL